MSNTIPLFKVFMSKTAGDAVKKVLSSGYIGQGPQVEKFEKVLQKRFSNKYVLTVNSATSGLHLALHLLKKKNDKISWGGLTPDDEVLVCPLTCVATSWSVLANNLKIKWVDADPDNLNIDLEDLRRKITKKTKIILFVHWGGYPVDLDLVKQIQEETEKKFGFRPAVVEDCAHAFGASYKGAPIGSHGNINVFSFQAIKHLTAGDGGALTLNSRELYDRGKLLRWFGIGRDQPGADFRCEGDIKEAGFKFHMNDINATIGLANAEKSDWVLSKHIENARYYNEQLKGIPGITLLENKLDRQGSYWIYTMKVEKRDDFMVKMKEKCIMTSRVHERNDLNTCVKEFRTPLPNIDKIVKEMVCIPNGWWVTEEDRGYILDCITKGW